MADVPQKPPDALITEYEEALIGYLMSGPTTDRTPGRKPGKRDTFERTSVRVPHGMYEWMRAQPEPISVIVERAIRAYQRLIELKNQCDIKRHTMPTE